MRNVAAARSLLILAAAFALAGPAWSATSVPVARAAATPASGAASAAVAPLVDACPAQLPVKQTVSQPLPGWTPLDQQGSYPFQRVAFFPGSPADANATLIVPTVEYKGQSGLHDGWDLPRRPGGYWMTCAYANTSATVARKLADDVDFCQADYDGRFLTLVVKHWSCGSRRNMPAPWGPNPRGARSSSNKAAGTGVRRGG